MSYPVALLYLPFGALLVARKRPWTDALVAAPAAFTVLCAGILSVRNRGVLLVDPHNGGGMFRGGGGGLAHSISTVLEAVRITLVDLFVAGGSYYCSLKTVEFGGWLGVAACVMTLGLGVWAAVTVQSSRVALGMALGLMACGLLLPSLANQVPGLRRCTGMLFGFYAVATLVHAHAPRRWLYSAPLWLLMAHHVVAVPGVLRDLGVESQWRQTWLNIEHTADASLQHWVDQVESGIPISCRDYAEGKRVECRYAEVYAAVAGQARWTQGRDVEVLALDVRTGQTLQLTTLLWETYFLDH